MTRQVTLSLRAQVGTLDEAVIHELLHTDQPRHIRVAAYRLLHVRDTWTRLAVDPHLVDDPQPALRHQARNDLANWLNQEAATTYSMPTGIRAHQLCALLTQAEVTLGADRIGLLRFHRGLRR